jgi:hypothetical protein
MLAWSLDPALHAGSQVLTGGVGYLVKVFCTKSGLVGNLYMAVGTAGITLTSNQNFIALFDTAGNRLGLSADQTTAWGTTGLKTAAITPVQVYAGQAYYIYMLSNGATPVSPRCAGNATQALTNMGLAAGAGRSMTLGTGLTSVASTLTMGSAAGFSAAFAVAMGV